MQSFLIEMKKPDSKSRAEISGQLPERILVVNRALANNGHEVDRYRGILTQDHIDDCIGYFYEFSHLSPP